MASKEALQLAEQVQRVSTYSDTTGVRHVLTQEEVAERIEQFSVGYAIQEALPPSGRFLRLVALGREAGWIK